MWCSVTAERVGRAVLSESTLKRTVEDYFSGIKCYLFIFSLK